MDERDCRETGLIQLRFVGDFRAVASRDYLQDAPPGAPKLPMTTDLRDDRGLLACERGLQLPHTSIIADLRSSQGHGRSERCLHLERGGGIVLSLSTLVAKGSPRQPLCTIRVILTLHA